MCHPSNDPKAVKLIWNERCQQHPELSESLCRKSLVDVVKCCNCDRNGKRRVRLKRGKRPRSY